MFMLIKNRLEENIGIGNSGKCCYYTYKTFKLKINIFRKFW